MTLADELERLGKLKTPETLHATENNSVVTEGNDWSVIFAPGEHIKSRHHAALAALMFNNLPAIIAALREQEWQPIDEHYEVSRGGEVRRRNGPVLKQWANNQGYMIVRLNGPRRTERVHRLVAKAFIPNPDEKPFVNHINNDRADNRASNLEWCTQMENLAHAERQGRMRRNYWSGRRSPNAKVTAEQVASIRADYAKGGASWDALAKRFGVCKRTVGRIIKGQSYV